MLSGEPEGFVSEASGCTRKALLREFYVYIMASRKRVLYTGVTNDPLRRVYEHRRSLVPGFTARYNVSRLVYYEAFGDPESAIRREKQIKGWLRSKKITLVESMNPNWGDLSGPWFNGPDPSLRSG